MEERPKGSEIQQATIKREAQATFDLKWMGEEIAALMDERALGLFRKISEIKRGERLVLTAEEKKFFADLVHENWPGIELAIVGIAGHIWGADAIAWKQPARKGGLEGREKTLGADIWMHFEAEPSPKSAQALVDFYLGTTREQALAEIMSWPEWQGRQDIKLK